MTTEFGGDERLLTIHGRGIGEVTDTVVSLAQERGYSVAATGPGQFRMVREKRPTWAIVAAIVTFPFLGLGLLFLLVKETDSGTAAIFEGRDGTKVRLVGAIDEEVVLGLEDPVRAQALAPTTSSEPVQGTAVGGIVAPPARSTSSPVQSQAPRSPEPRPLPNASQESKPSVAAPSLIDTSPIARRKETPKPLDPSVEKTVARPMGIASSQAGTFVVFPDGRSVPLGRGIVVGRSPQPPQGKEAMLPFAYPDGSLSKTHAALEPSSSGLTITDLHSTNGTSIAQGGHLSHCTPGQPVDVPQGAEILAGDVVIQIRENR